MTEPSIPKIMLVEDDPQFAYLIERYARSRGCQIHRVHSFSEAVPIAQNELPDLILLDLALNGAAGWQVLQALKANPITRKLDVFICVANEAAAHGWEDYADGCLVKPVMFEDFVTAVASIPHRSPDGRDNQVQGQTALARQEVNKTSN